MLFNYFKIAFKNLPKNKIYMFINIGGLGLGGAVAILIRLWVYNELSTNKYHRSTNKIEYIHFNSTKTADLSEGSSHIQCLINSALETNYKDLYAKNAPKDFYKIIESYEPEIFKYLNKQWHLSSDFTDSKTTDRPIKAAVSLAEVSPKIEAVLHKLVSLALFDYKFIDENYYKKFSQERLISRLSTLFAILAIFIFCFRLFINSFVNYQSIKEINICKALYARVSNLWQILSKNFVVLIIISYAFTYYFKSQLLIKYNYHTEIWWWIFAVISVGALVITLLTVSYQAISINEPNKEFKN